jgi:SMODS-associating 2TM, beta-strand rich effector domain
MVERKTVQIIVGIVAGVWLVLALLAGQTLSPMPLRLYSVSVAAVTLVFLTYDQYLWRWKFVRYFTGLPLLEGTWRGTLFSSFIRDGQQIPPTSVVLRIKQSAFSVSITLFTAESSSVSEQARLTKESDGRWRLSWLYANTPRPSVRYRSDRHHGACYLYIGATSQDGLRGEYFTDRLTRGELKLTEWSKHKYDGAESALASQDFEKPHPFVRVM